MHTFIQVGLIHALPTSDRRCYDRKETASYIGVSPAHLDKLVRFGQIPPPIDLLGKKVWNRTALDQAIDAQSGISQSSSSDDLLDRELAAFQEQHGYGPA